MSTPSSRAGFWNHHVWASIDEGVTASIGAIRVAQKVFPPGRSPIQPRYPPTSSTPWR